MVPHWLIVSGGARALAQSCVAAGWTCDVIDPFTDTDTIALARRAVRAGFEAGRFGDDLPAKVTELDGPWHGIVTGSGFERCPALLEALGRFAPLTGNDAQTIRRCKWPDAFTAGLDRAGIAHAPVSTAGRAMDGWLIKQTGACGGAHVRAAVPGEAIRPGWYAQQHLAGAPASVLFLADGRRGHIVGISRHQPGSPAGPFAWCEAISGLPEDDAQGRALADDVDAMVREFGLRGLNGADLVLNGRAHAVVEINPRPTATMALHEDRVAGGLFAAHVAACTGQIGHVETLPMRSVRGLRVVYAPYDLRIGDSVRWPDGCTDLPAAGSAVAQATPLCTVHAAGQDEASVRARLRQGEHEVLGIIHKNDLEFLRRSA